MPKPKKTKGTNKTKVYVRFRPANKHETESTQHLGELNDKNIYACEVCDQSGCEQRKIMVNDSYKTREYTFDHAFSRYDTQANVYRNTTAPLITNLLHGKNSSLICYGQTGSGKTYTLFGNSCDLGTQNHMNDEDGIISRAIDDLFYKIQQTEIPGEIEYQVEISFVQIYNEEVKDLLLPQQDNLTVRMVEEPTTGELQTSEAMDVWVGQTKRSVIERFHHADYCYRKFLPATLDGIQRRTINTFLCEGPSAGRQIVLSEDFVQGCSEAFAFLCSCLERFVCSSSTFC